MTEQPEESISHVWEKFASSQPLTVFELAMLRGVKPGTIRKSLTLAGIKTLPPTRFKGRVTISAEDCRRILERPRN